MLITRGYDLNWGNDSSVKQFSATLLQLKHLERMSNSPNTLHWTLHSQMCSDLYEEHRPWSCLPLCDLHTVPWVSAGLFWNCTSQPHKVAQWILLVSVSLGLSTLLHYCLFLFTPRSCRLLLSSNYQNSRHGSNPTGLKKNGSDDLRPSSARLCPSAEQIHARLHWAGHDGQDAVQQVSSRVSNVTMHAVLQRVTEWSKQLTIVWCLHFQNSWYHNTSNKVPAVYCKLEMVQSALAKQELIRKDL